MEIKHFTSFRFLALWIICIRVCEGNVVLRINGDTTSEDINSVKTPSNDDLDYVGESSETGLTSPEYEPSNDDLDNVGESFDTSLTSPEYEGTGENVIIRIETLGNGGIKSDDVTNEKNTVTEQNENENTTIPSLVCWEMTCPDCTELESDFRCFARSLLTVIVRTTIFGVVLVMLAACILIVNHKEKKSDPAGNCELGLHGDDKEKLVNVDLNDADEMYWKV